MKSGKKRRTEIKEKRAERKLLRSASKQSQRDREVPAGALAVRESLLAPNNSYSVPDFVRRGYYEDQPFQCVGCGKAEVWTATQQRWWYEVAKGDVFTRALRCRACRRIERERKTEAQRIHLEGISQKENQKGSIQKGS
jgi:hypothetical protein